MGVSIYLHKDNIIDVFTKYFIQIIKCFIRLVIFISLHNESVESIHKIVILIISISVYRLIAQSLF